MDILEASAKLERIELLAKLSHSEEVSLREKSIALQWVAEIVREMQIVIRKETLSISNKTKNND
ncbi:hypothetical protein [Enterobacter quasiroggenkampii]|uniref:hypothetical protein n=1 Tax=Enterobacter quasiroggenkampii TaxID=2497436 RepID=UPI0021D29E2F|nr:hypothetical protein [Enterobacter quasiroggenkampii]MCU6305333.1 hypothetical protein [Enterobacter quasiroggenkampii]